MELEAIILLLRILLIALLYLFLLAVVAVILRDLRAASRRVAEPEPRYGQLIVLEAGQTGLSPGDVFALRPITSLGRSLTNTIILPDTFVSAEHALLAYRDGHWWLEDLGSTNGTFVNGMRIEEPIIVGQGDEIGLGQVRLKLEMRT